MKKLLTLALVAITFGATAQTFPVPSPSAKVYQMVGLNEMEITYSSPGVRDRAIFGGMLPNGELWRTGANSTTTLTASDKFVVGGKEVAAGTYSIFTIPAENEITFILNSDASASTGNYNGENDVARVTVPFNKGDKSMERMQFTFENMTPNDAEIAFRWADRSFKVPVRVMSKEAAEKNFKAKLAEYEGEFSLYSQASNYYYEIGDYKEALAMAKKSTEMSKKFWNMYALALAYQATGDKKNAKIASQESLKMAKEIDYKHYIVLNEKLLSEL